MLMAAGLDPERCILFRQSDVHEHSELCWLLASVTPYGDLQRMTQFKDKSAREQQLVRTSLFLYPVLMAADILLYRTDQVPVGDDQRQHVELAREIARRFNATYGEVLVEPEAVIPQVGARIMDLQDPDSKMSTTYGSDSGLIYIDDEADAIVKKVKRAQTDSGSEIVRAPDKQGITNLIDIYSVARGVAPAEVEREFAGQGYGAFKQAVGEATAELLAPDTRPLPRAACRRGGPRAGAPAGRRPRARDRCPGHGGGPFRDGNGPRVVASEARVKEMSCDSDHKEHEGARPPSGPAAPHRPPRRVRVDDLGDGLRREPLTGAASTLSGDVNRRARP